ncbi:transposase [Agarivorans sp. Toyoura001]|uniref:transposase n=1 Tax=unclassified Agarivorans TaxID=2636026 RepID=UPI0010DF4595|nr:transposase [Agarivorans sp. Toyoura001]GDY27124.1 transposase [Agarivorans sp. Toyoura001]
MARKLRVSYPGVAEHLIQRGNNRQIIFANDEDMQAYVAWLKQYAKQYQVAIHAWVLMTNHVHLLCTPSTATGISTMMQSLGRMYVLYFNRRYQRTGTLWEGRFKSCLIESEAYFMQVSRYIELNPVRANMVSDPADYSWSSYQCSALGKRSSLLSEHQLYASLGGSPIERQSAYRALFANHIEGKLLNDIRQATHKGLALGSEQFKQEIETLTGLRVTEGIRGRREGWRKHGD